MDSQKKNKENKRKASRSKTKSPAEFFSEHQNIAGFDNAGKSLYTTVRELVENSLDAAESIRQLPDIEITIEQLSTSQLSELRGSSEFKRVDHSLYETKSKSKKKQRIVSNDGDNENGDDGNNIEGQSKSGREYFIVTCRDNGSGIAHEDIPNLFGIVLSSTKYEVKQTRGKFGLGAKMALVWSKKSTGLPIEIYSSTSETADISYYKLDIDIHRNVPIILAERRLKSSGCRGTEVSVTIEGKWSSYRSRLISYLRQLAIITPYARFQLVYKKYGVASAGFRLTFAQRTQTMPPLPKVVKHHPSSVDNLIVEQLISQTSSRNLGKFLTNEFAEVNQKMASRLIAELGDDFASDTAVKSMNRDQIHSLVTLMRSAVFPSPSGTCLSPAGEYNLRLGIEKEIEPNLVATASSAPLVFEGHPFKVEAGVALGGQKAKVGITVYRFANRIPLLFEGGNDVSTKVANLKIKWSYYKIRPKVDRIGVFVSLVSTKIPFKGTSKEYIGDDHGILHDTVRSTISECCKQLKSKLLRESSLKIQRERKRMISRYVPDVSRALLGVLIQKNQKFDDEEERESPTPVLTIDGTQTQVTRDLVSQKLELHIEKADAEASAMDALSGTGRLQQILAHHERVSLFLQSFKDFEGDTEESVNGPSLLLGNSKSCSVSIRLTLPFLY